MVVVSENTSSHSRPTTLLQPLFIHVSLLVLRACATIHSAALAHKQLALTDRHVSQQLPVSRCMLQYGKQEYFLRSIA